MSGEPTQRRRSPFSSWLGSGAGRVLFVPLLALSAGIWVLALAGIGQSWEMARMAGRYQAPARVGDLVSATLVNGQVFFGTLDAASRTTIRLHDVFFAQPPGQDGRAADPNAAAHAPIIVRRKDNEWTQADVMAIPIERIAYMENIGADSRMARFIADVRSRPQMLPADQPAGRAPGTNLQQP